MYPRYVSFYDEETLCEEMKKIGADEAGIRIMAPKGKFYAVKVLEVPLKAALILKQEMLSKGGEVVLPLQASTLSVEKVDVLIMGTFKQYKELINKLKIQPFGLKKLGIAIEKLLKNLTEKQTCLRLGEFTFPLGKRTLIMGILNVTPDSFSDGGKFLSKEKALYQAEKMVKEGADIIDIGGESTRPGSTPISEEEELARVIPIIEVLSSKIEVPISIDTYKSRVAKEAVKSGAKMINDVWGLKKDPNIATVVSRYQVPVCIMHNRVVPKYNDLMSDIILDLQESIDIASEAGIDLKNIIIDPGIGFAKNLKENLEVMRRLEELKTLGRPILLGSSRKSMIGKTLALPVNERIEGTAATVAYGITKGVDIVRVHDVQTMVRVARMTDAMLRGEEGIEER